MAEVQRELARGPVSLDLPDDLTVAGLLECLAERYGATFRRRTLAPSGQVRSGVRVFVDDELVESNASLTSVLRPDSKVALVVLMSQHAGG